VRVSLWGNSTLKTGGGVLVQLPIMAEAQPRQKIDVSKLEGKDYAGAFGLLYNPRELLCAKAGVASATSRRGSEDVSVCAVYRIAVARAHQALDWSANSAPTIFGHPRLRRLPEVIQ
jgi:hypothetical protein